MGFANVEPTISVVIPAYNCDRTIERTLESVLQQENCSYEILVIDCGSSDCTPEILATYSQRLRYVRHQQSVAAALNRGISLAKGDLITFLVGDDYFLPNKLASQAAIFVQRNDIGMVDSGWQRMSDGDRKRIEVCPWENIPELNLTTWLDRQFITLSTMMFRREWLQYVGGFDRRFWGAEAWDLALKLSLNGCRSAWLQQVTVGRQYEGTTEQSLLLAAALSAVMDNFFTQPDLPATVRLKKNLVCERTLVWCAWYLDYSGQRAEATTYLKRAWDYRSVSLAETIVNWIESFASFSLDWGMEFDANLLTASDEWQQLLRWAMEIANKTASN